MPCAQFAKAKCVDFYRALIVCYLVSTTGCWRQCLTPSGKVPPQATNPAWGIDSRRFIRRFQWLNGWFCSVKDDVREGFHDLRGECRFKADDYLQYLPVAANVGLGFVGAKPRHSFRERVVATATAYAAMGIMVNTTKYAINEKRPDSGALNSFPSGHTATAFMGAELVREEYGTGYGIGAYTLAAGIAFMRLYNDRHWLNDIIAGAGVGILSARIGYWLLPWERKILGWDKCNASVSLMPVYNPIAHSASISLVANL